MATDKQRQLSIAALGYDCFAPKVPRARLCSANGRIVRDVEVQVSPADYNFRGAGPRGFVRIDYAAYEQQRLRAEADREAEAKRRREIDPFNYGHWNKD